LYPTETGVLMLGDLGSATGLGEIKSAALRYDRNGTLQAKTGFAHDIYRIGVHPMSLRDSDCGGETVG
jgi:hypothetical protein